MRDHATFAACLAVALLTAPGLAAQDRIYGADGAGTLHTGDQGGQQEVRHVEATLYQNGGIDLKLSTGRDRWIFRGTWNGSPSSGSVGFRLDSGFELPADGSGRLYFLRDAIDRVDFRGTNRNGDFEFTFAGPGGSPGASPILDIAHTGDGDLDLGEDADRLDRVRVRLTDDGLAELRLRGARRYTVTGRWSGTLASGSVRLELTAWGSDAAEITGTINTPPRSGWDRVTLDGTTKGRAVRVRFSGVGEPLDSSDGDDDGDPHARRPVDALDQTMRGNGTLSLDRGRGADLRTVRVDLRRGGRAEISLDGSAPPVLLRGKWSQRDNAPRIDLSITDGPGPSGLGGRGTLTIPDGRSWESLELAGGTRAGRWTVAFHATGPGHLATDSIDLRPDSEPIREFSATAIGDGALTWPGVPEPTTVNRVRLVLSADQEAVMEVEGARPAHFTGRWATTSQPNQLALTLTGGTIVGLIATGVITLDDRRAVAAVSMDGRQLHRLVKLVFRVLPAAPAPC